MKFALTQQSNLEQEKINSITEISQDLKKYFKSKNYGKSIEEFLIGITCVKAEFELFFKVRKPKYIERKAEVHDGFPVEIKKSFSYDIKLDFVAFSNATKEEMMGMLALQIMDSLIHLNLLPKKVRDFNSVLFKSDLEDFFKKRDLI